MALFKRKREHETDWMEVLREQILTQSLHNFGWDAPELPQREVTVMEPERVVTAEEIHADLYGEADKLMKEYEETITKDIEEKVGLLSECGFTNTPELRRNSTSIYFKKVMDEARIEFPTCKFITNAIVETLCEKYGLVHGEVERFKGFVPKKNLLELKKFNDKNPASYSITRYTPAGHEYKNNVSKEEFESPESGWSPYEVRRKHTLTILAPVKDMELRHNESVVGSRIVAQDPIVLADYKGGYLIVTAWGDEASDELVVNQNNN